MAAREAQGRREQEVPARCSHCNAPQRPRARYCAHCGTPQTEEAWAECEITWWRGYADGEFIAARFDGLGLVPIDVIIRWPDGHASPEEEPRVIRALAALATELESDGWERVGQGEDGHEYRLRRGVSEYPGATQVGATITQHQPREAASQRVTEQVAEPVHDELTTGEREPVEPLLIERELAERDSFKPELAEPPARLEVGDSSGFEPDDFGPADSEPRTTDPEPDSGEPWFTRPRSAQELSAPESEMADTILVDRISAYSFNS